MTDAITGGSVSAMEPIRTPQRTVRISDRIWKAAQEKAQQRGERVSDVIRLALIRYIEDEEES